MPGIGGRVDLDETTGYRDYKEHIGQYYKPEVSGIRAGDTVRVTAGCTPPRMEAARERR